MTKAGSQIQGYNDVQSCTMSDKKKDQVALDHYFTFQ